jgi:hypothetical protein
MRGDLRRRVSVSNTPWPVLFKSNGRMSRDLSTQKERRFAGSVPSLELVERVNFQFGSEQKYRADFGRSISLAVKSLAILLQPPSLQTNGVAVAKIQNHPA